MQIILNAMITQCSVIINQTIHLIYYIPCILQLHLQLWSPQMLLWKHFCHMRRITKWAQPCFNIGSSSQIVCEPKLATAFFTLSAEKCNICTKNLYRLGCVILHVPWWLIASSEHSVKQFWVLRCTSRCVWKLCRPWSWTWTGTGWRCGLRPPSRSPSLRARSSWTSAWSRCPWKRTTPGWGSCSLPP